MLIFDYPVVMNFNLNTSTGIISFNERLEKRSYAAGDGYFPTQLDLSLFTSVKAAPTCTSREVHFFRWYKHIASFSDLERSQWPQASHDCSSNPAPVAATVKEIKAVELPQNVSAVDTTGRTVLSYLQDTYKFTHSCTIVAAGEEQRGPFCIVDSTIFYPQGGGQPSDIGTIEFDDGDKLKITFVNLLPNGCVQHFMDRPISESRIGQRILQRVDEALRIENAKAHTGGHLLSCVVERIAPELVGCKGYHFKQGPYVEFEGKLTSMSAEELRTRASVELNNIVSCGAPVTAREVPGVEMAALRVATRYHLPAGKTCRLVQIDGFEPVPCGGTHLRNVNELKEVSIRKIQLPKGNVKIGYVAA